MSSTSNEILPILYKDDFLVIIDKPPNLLVHPNKWDTKSPNCVDTLQRQLDHKVYPVHRIDRGSSGVVVFAKDSQSARFTTEQFRDRKAKKIYLALARGHLKNEITIDRSLNKENSNIRSVALSHARPIATATIPEPVSIYNEGWYSFVELLLETGRFHQARRHLRHLNHPIIGDRRHGDREQNHFFSKRFGISHMFLRAFGLTIFHPRHGALLHAQAGLPKWWIDSLDQLGISVSGRYPVAPVVDLETQ